MWSLGFGGLGFRVHGVQVSRGSWGYLSLEKGLGLMWVQGLAFEVPG